MTENPYRLKGRGEGARATGVGDGEAGARAGAGDGGGGIRGARGAGGGGFTVFVGLHWICLLILPVAVTSFGIEEGAVRLREGRCKSEGRVEIYHSDHPGIPGQWGTICAAGFSDTEAVVTCHQLGYSGEDANLLPTPNGTDIVWLENIVCSLTKKRLLDCLISDAEWHPKECKDGMYAGVRCNSVVCQPNPCGNNGTCLPAETEVGFMCTCAPGYTGDTCQTYLDLCQPNPCQNNGTCHQDEKKTGFMCTCAPGFSGETCQKDVDVCQSNPCLNNGTCCSDGTEKGFTCICAPGYTGDTCHPLTQSRSLGIGSVIGVIVVTGAIISVTIWYIIWRRRRRRVPMKRLVEEEGSATEFHDVPDSPGVDHDL